MAILQRKKLVLILAIIGALGGIVWWQRDELLARYYVMQLTQASEEERAGWVNKVVDLDLAVVPHLLDRLEHVDAVCCANVAAALEKLACRWGPADSRALNLAGALENLFPRMSGPGRQGALEVVGSLLHAAKEKPDEGLLGRASRLAAAAAPESALTSQALSLAANLVQHGQIDQCYQTLALDGLKATGAAQRVLAVNLAFQLAKRGDSTFLEKLVPLLRDPEARVRRAALVALGPCRDVIGDEDLLGLLHDPDAEVQLLCELALRSRGLQENHIVLARLISDANPAARLAIFAHLQRIQDLDPGIWLRRLTQDSDRAVRAAAIRAACQDQRVNLRDRIRQMAQDDPSDTVRNIARAYLE